MISEAGAPFGSLYHFFPGGKEDLACEVIRWSGSIYGRLIPVVLESAPDPVNGVLAFFDAAAEQLRESGYADACPIATVALEVSSSSEPLRAACAEVFESWISSAAGYFARAGVGESEARGLAIAMIAALEGAFVLARALRSTEPLAVAGRMSAEAVRAAL
ncbi:MAG: TetR family transcriptional regulator C-terminal domain-containing protein [Solirubrobacteraceae bacterium]